MCLLPLRKKAPPAPLQSPQRLLLLKPQLAMAKQPLKSYGGSSSVSGAVQQDPATPPMFLVQMGSRLQGWVQSHDAIHIHGQLLVWTDSLPRVGPVPWVAVCSFLTS